MSYLKLISKIDSFNRYSKGKLYPTKLEGDFYTFFDNNAHIARIETSKVHRYFRICNCGSWSNEHSAFCRSLKDESCLKLVKK